MKKMRNTKSILLLTLVVVIVLGSVGGTLAYLIAETPEVKNIFNPSEVTSAVVETFPAGSYEKTDVKITNTGDVDAYIRAAVVVTWQDMDGNTLATVPDDASYTISFNTGDWKSIGGYYYYDSVVASGATTADALVTSCTQDNYRGDYRLCVEIIGSAVQADGEDSNGKTPVKLAWGVTADQFIAK